MLHKKVAVTGLAVCALQPNKTILYVSLSLSGASFATKGSSARVFMILSLHLRTEILD